MNYRLDRYGNKISLLGFGCMRLPQTAGIINKAEAEKQIMAAYNAGVNYFDTAYIYPGSESAIGEIFEKNGIRKNINIATKLPHYLIKTKDGLDKLFNEELKRLRTDYIDYYLMHMLTDLQSWEKLKAIGIVEWIADNAMLQKVAEAINSKMKVGCTACGYCMPCPAGVDIPGTFAAYNRRYTESRFWGFIEYTMCTALRKDAASASKCIGCGKCERHCPQSIEIRKELGKAAKELENPAYKFVVKSVDKLKLFG